MLINLLSGNGHWNVSLGRWTLGQFLMRAVPYRHVGARGADGRNILVTLSIVIVDSVI